MTKIRAAFLLLLCGLVVPASAADMSGKWKITFKSDRTRIPDLACNLTQTDRRIEGACKAGAWSTDERVDLIDGKVDGDQLTWRWKLLVPDGVTWTWAFTGTLDADGSSVKGIVKLSDGLTSEENEVNFIASKQ